MTTTSRSYNADWLRSLAPSQQAKVLDRLTPEEAATLALDYDFWARQGQREPAGDWTKWLLLGGRGAGKTWVGANMVRRWAESGKYPKILLGAPTPADARDVMVEGESGILAISPKRFRPRYYPSKRLLVWPNGVRAHIRSGAEPEGFRGLNSYKAWLDELCAWQYAQASYDMALFGLRLGQRPQAVITTTPKPLHVLRDLIKDPTCVTTRETSYANRANLSAVWFADIISKYEGTRLGRQELYADVLDEVPGALWRPSLIEATRVAPTAVTLADFGRIVVAVDPAVTSSANSNETGIIAVAAGKGVWKGHAFVLRDQSGRHAATYWPKLTSALYHALSADRVVAEVNNGGDLVESAVRVADPLVSYRAVHASRGKRARAEPVAALYEQGKVHHVGLFRELEDQMCTYVPDERAEPDPALADAGVSDSPDRVDALVWGITDLLLGVKVFIA